MNVLSFRCSTCHREFKLEIGPKKQESIAMQIEKPDDYEVIFRERNGENGERFSSAISDHVQVCSGQISLIKRLIVD